MRFSKGLPPAEGVRAGALVKLADLLAPRPPEADLPVRGGALKVQEPPVSYNLPLFDSMPDSPTSELAAWPGTNQSGHVRAMP